MTVAEYCAGEGNGALVLELGANASGYANAAQLQWMFDAADPHAAPALL